MGTWIQVRKYYTSYPGQVTIEDNSPAVVYSHAKTTFNNGTFSGGTATYTQTVGAKVNG